MTTSELDDRIDDVARQIMSSAPRSDLRMRVLAALGSPDPRRHPKRIAIWWLLAPATVAVLLLVFLRNPAIPPNAPNSSPPRTAQVPPQPTAAAATPRAPVAVAPRVARANRRLNHRVYEHVSSDIDPSALMVDPIEVSSLSALESLDAPALTWREIDVPPIVIDDVSDKRQEPR